MKRFGIAAAICATTAGASYAQSSVTLYGILDAALTSAKVGQGVTLPGGTTATPSTSVTQLASGVGPASRLGFRGVEDMGGGLKANFALEMGFGTDTGDLQQGGSAFGRQSFVGLTKDSISLTLGRQYGPLFWAFVTADPLGGAYWGNVTNQAGHGTNASVGSAPGSGTYQDTARVDNSAMVTWSAGPFTARVIAAAGNENATRDSGRQVGASLTYNQGPLMLNAGYTHMRTPDSMLPASAKSPDWMDEAVLSGGYDFGFARVFAGVYQFKGPRDHSVMVPQLAANPFAYDWDKSRTYWLGVTAPIGSGKLLLNVARHEYDYSTRADGRSTTYAATYEYFLSKRTAVYASYGNVHNNSTARASLFGATTLVAGGYGANLSALSFGLRHSF